MEIRKEECKTMIDTLFEEKFAQTELGFDDTVELELEKLIVGGHSFGGMTAIAVSECDERVKATVTLDPWLWIIMEKIDNREYKVNNAQCHVVSEGFSPEVEKR
jgi:pimeloyl-ACP methyl ester carboxylesterase